MLVLNKLFLMKVNLDRITLDHYQVCNKKLIVFLNDMIERHQHLINLDFLIYLQFLLFLLLFYHYKNQKDF